MLVPRATRLPSANEDSNPAGVKEVKYFTQTRLSNYYCSKETSSAGVPGSDGRALYILLHMHGGTYMDMQLKGTVEWFRNFFKKSTNNLDFD